MNGNMDMEVPASALEPIAARKWNRSWATAAIVLVLVATVYSQTWRELWPLWMDTQNTTYTHGLLVALVSTWLVWRKRGELVSIELQPGLWAIPLVLFLSLAWMVFAKAGMLTLHAALWPLLAWFSVLAACGWPVARAMAFPLAYLWFAVPVWDHLNRTLQTGTVIAVDMLNRLTHVPALVEGDLVTIPSGQFEIASGCSGLHFFMVALAIGAIAGELHNDRLRTRLLLVTVAGGLALLSNWLRVYFIILAGHLSDMQHYLVQVDHYKFGWVVFACAMFVFFLVVRRLPVQATTEKTGTVALPERAVTPRLLAAIVVILLWPAVSWLAHSSRETDDQGPFDAPRLEGYTGPLSPSPAWRPRFKGPEAELRVAYMTSQGRVLDYYANRYFDQSQSGELISYTSAIVDGPVMRAQSRLRFSVTDSGRQVVFNRTNASSSREEWVVLSHYYVGDTILAGERRTQLAIGLRGVFGTSQSGVRAAAAPCGGDCDTVLKDLSGLLTRISELPR